MHIKILWYKLRELYPTPESFPIKDAKLTPPPTPESSPGYEATPPYGTHRTSVTPTPSPQYAPNPSQNDEGTTMKSNTDYQVSSSDENNQTDAADDTDEDSLDSRREVTHCNVGPTLSLPLQM